jgi:hypothetical protein
MTDSCSVLTVPFCHSSGHTFPQLVLLAFLACSLGVASPSISVRVSSETTPPGGYAQLKIFAAPPALISAASIALNLDPTIFGPISSINAFSATGDQIGSVQRAVNAQTGAESQPIYVTSASASLGQLPDLPIFIVNVPVLATAKIGVTSSITVDPTTFPWKDQNQNSYTVTVNPGTFTVGGNIIDSKRHPWRRLAPHRRDHRHRRHRIRRDHHRYHRRRHHRLHQTRQPAATQPDPRRLDRDGRQTRAPLERSRRVHRFLRVAQRARPDSPFAARAPLHRG